MERLRVAAVIRRAVWLVAPLVLLAACGAGAGATVAPRHAATTSAAASPSPSATPTPTPTAAPTPASAATLRVLGLGDSVMAGTNCGCSGLVEEYAAALGRRTHRPVHVDNLGANGAVTTDLLDDLIGDHQTRALASQADVVVVTIGANDLVPQLQTWESSGCPASCFKTAAEEVGHNLTRVLRRLKAARGGRTNDVLVTDYWNVFLDGQVALDSEGAAEQRWSVRVTNAANAAICRAAQTEGAICVDLVKPFKGSGDRDPTPLLADDGDHPNAAGMKVIVRALMKATPHDL